MAARNFVELLVLRDNSKTHSQAGTKIVAHIAHCTSLQRVRHTIAECALALVVVGKG